MEDIEYVKINKWALQTREPEPETIAVCTAENKVVAIEYFSQVKRLTVEQLLEIYQVNILSNHKNP